MKYRGPHSPLGLLITRLAFASLLLALIPAECVKAQPGRPAPSLGELEKELQPRLDELAGQISEDPQNAALYVSNGIGTWFPLRTNARPEMAHLTLRRA